MKCGHEQTIEMLRAEIARLEHERADLIAAGNAVLPLLVRLGDFIGNGPVNPDDPHSLGERCDVILALKDALDQAAGEPTEPHAEGCKCHVCEGRRFTG